MSWIQENKFAAGLAGVTFVAVGGLWYWGNGCKDKTQEARDLFAQATGQIRILENGRLYPSEANRDLKRKAVTEYTQQAVALRDRMIQFRPASLDPVASEVFSKQLQESGSRVQAAFQTSKTSLPQGFLMGFESYSSSVAQRDATGLLGYQVKATEWLFIKLAEARPEAVLNVHRPRLPEEKGTAYAYQKGDVARDLPIEITFSGSARALREFMSSLVDSKEFYFVPRVVRIENEKTTPPSRSDAQFKVPSTAPTADGFGQTLPDPAADPTAQPTPEREEILKQVLGNEQVRVFLRIDLRLFREAAGVALPELPKNR